MKRTLQILSTNEEVEENHDPKRRKDEKIRTFYISDDNIRDIMNFLEHRFIVRVCSLVSKQFFSVASAMVKLKLGMIPIRRLSYLQDSQWANSIYEMGHLYSRFYESVWKLEKFTNLEKLILYSNDDKLDLDMLKLANLSDLVMAFSGVMSPGMLNSISAHPKLKNLGINISSFVEGDLAIIAKSKTIEALSLASNYPCSNVSLTPIWSMVNLVGFRYHSVIDSMVISDFDEIGNLESLESLELMCHLIRSSFAVLSGMKKLTSLKLWCGIFDRSQIDVILNNPNLKYISLRGYDEYGSSVDIKRP